VTIISSLPLFAISPRDGLLDALRVARPAHRRQHAAAARRAFLAHTFLIGRQTMEAATRRWSHDRSGGFSRSCAAGAGLSLRRADTDERAMGAFVGVLLAGAADPARR